MGIELTPETFYRSAIKIMKEKLSNKEIQVMKVIGICN